MQNQSAKIFEILQIEPTSVETLIFAQFITAAKKMLDACKTLDRS